MSQTRTLRPVLVPVVRCWIWRSSVCSDMRAERPLDSGFVNTIARNDGEKPGKSAKIRSQSSFYLRLWLRGWWLQTETGAPVTPLIRKTLTSGSEKDCLRQSPPYDIAMRRAIREAQNEDFVRRLRVDLSWHWSGERGRRQDVDLRVQQFGKLYRVVPGLQFQVGADQSRRVVEDNLQCRGQH